MREQTNNEKLYLSGGKYNKVTVFLLPSVGFTARMLVKQGLINAYLSDKEYSIPFGVNSPCLFLLFNCQAEDYLEDLPSIIRDNNKDIFVESYFPEKGKIMIVLKIPDKWIDTVYKPFIEGKYSKINRDYVNENYSKNIIYGYDSFNRPQIKRSKNWMILHKDPFIKYQIEEDFEITLDDDAEVFSKPDHKDHYERKVQRKITVR